MSVAGAPRSSAKLPAVTALVLLGVIATSTTVVVEAPAEPELLERVLGQLSDLPYTVEVASRTSTTGAPGVRAKRLARTRQVAAILLVDGPEAGGCTVTVSHVPSGRLLSRTVEPVESRSATWETCALIARSTLQAMSAWRQQEERPPPRVEPLPPPEPVPTPARPRPPEIGVEAAIGWRAGTDGEGPFGPHGPEVRVAVRGHGWAAGLELAADLPERLEDSIARIELSRYRTALGGSVDVTSIGPLSLSAALSLGASIHRRSTFPVGEAVVATAPRTIVAFSARGEARLSYDLGSFFELELAAGVDALAGVPAIRYARGDRVVARARPWPVQPHARLGVVFRSGP